MPKVARDKRLPRQNAIYVTDDVVREQLQHLRRTGLDSQFGDGVEFSIDIALLGQGQGVGTKLRTQARAAERSEVLAQAVLSSLDQFLG